MNGNQQLLDKNMLMYSINQPASVHYSMGQGVPGSYANIRFVANKYDGWKRQPANTTLLPDKLYVPMGTPLPLKNEEIAMELPADSMLFWARNRASPQCQGTLSTDRGGVCTTPEQRNYVGVYKAGNNTYPNEW